MEKEKHNGQTGCYISYGVIFLQMKFWLQLLTIHMFKSNYGRIVGEKKVEVLCKSGFLPFSLPVGLVAFKTEQCEICLFNCYWL